MKNTNTLIAAVALSMLLVAAPVHAASLTEAQIQAILGLLTSFNVGQSVLSNVESALRGTPTSGAGSSASLASPSDLQCAYANGVTLTMAQGSSDSVTGGQVSKLQHFLAYDKTVYPEGLVTGYYGAATERAVARFQIKNAVLSSTATASTPGYGIVTAATRGAIWKGCPPPGASVTITDTPPAGSGTVIPGAQPTVTMKFAGTLVQPGQPATLTWTSVNATRCTLDDGGKKTDVAANGSIQVYPTGVSSYKMSCINDADPYNLRMYTQTLTASSTPGQ